VVNGHAAIVASEAANRAHWKWGTPG
jgi:hypothetical protein